jgi:hypothetical protein
LNTVGARGARGWWGVPGGPGPPVGRGWAGFVHTVGARDGRAWSDARVWGVGTGPKGSQPLRDLGNLKIFGVIHIYIILGFESGPGRVGRG